jgi:carotenoid cleavage dioxygenase
VNFVTDSNDWSSYCLIFDAKDISQGPVCKIKMPHRLPFGFHANWIRGEDIF